MNVSEHITDLTYTIEKLVEAQLDNTAKLNAIRLALPRDQSDEHTALLKIIKKHNEEAGFRLEKLFQSLEKQPVVEKQLEAESDEPSAGRQMGPVLAVLLVAGLAFLLGLKTRWDHSTDQRKVMAAKYRFIQAQTLPVFQMMTRFTDSIYSRGGFVQLDTLRLKPKLAKGKK